MWFYTESWYKIFGLSINVIIISNQAGRIYRCEMWTKHKAQYFEYCHEMNCLSLFYDWYYVDGIFLSVPKFSK